MPNHRIVLAVLLFAFTALACDLSTLPFIGGQSLDDLANDAQATAEAAATLAFSKIATRPAETPAGKAAPVSPKAGTTPQTGQQAPTDPVSGSLDALSNLNSFHYKWQSDSTATKSGKTQNVVLSAEGDVSRTPPAQHVTFRAQGQSDIFENICIGNDAWIKTRGTWTKIPNATAIGCKQFDWSTLWSGVFKGIRRTQSIGVPEVKNGELSWHYRVLEASGIGAGGAGVAVVESDYWVSVTRGFPVSFVYKGNYKDAQGDSVQFIITWDITNVDKPVTITAPK